MGGSGVAVLAAALLVAQSGANMAGCNRGPTRSNASRPDLPATDQASGILAQPADSAPDDGCKIGGARKPLLARWTSTQRAALENAMKTSIAVMAADDCRGLRLLSDCRVRGHYGYLGRASYASRVDLSTDEELRVNAPLGSATDSAGSKPLRVETTIAGERATTRDALTPAEVSGDCAGATHYISAAQIGAVSVGPPNDVRPTVESCQSARPGDLNPVATCSTLVS